MNEFYLKEAFAKLDLLEDDFQLDADAGKIDDLRNFVADDIEAPAEEEIIDVEAEEVDDLQDNYVGKVILECACCHSRIYKDEADVIINETDDLANEDEECPVCGQANGWVVVGKIEKFDKDNAEAEEPVEEPEEGERSELLDDEIDEALKEALGETKTVSENKLGNDVCPECGKNPCVCEDCHKEDLDEEMLDHGNTHKEFKADGGIASDDTKSLEDDQTDLVKAANEKEPALTEGKENDLAGEDEEKLEKSNLEEDFEKEIERHNAAKRWLHSKEGHDAYVKAKKENPNLDADEFAVANAPRNESLEESVTIDVNNGQVTSDGNDAKVDLQAGTVEVGDNVSADAGEMIAPLDDEDIADIESNVSPDELDLEAPEDELGLDDLGAEADANVEDDIGADETGEDAEVLADEEEAAEEEEEEAPEFAEESFDYLGTSYMKKIYENVESYKTTSVVKSDDKYMIEGLITFNSGKSKPTTFVFENAKTTKRGKTLFEGKNETFSKANKAFILKANVSDNRFVCETLTYNYTAKTLNESNESETVRVYGRIKK